MAKRNRQDEYNDRDDDDERDDDERDDDERDDDERDDDERDDDERDDESKEADERDDKREEDLGPDDELEEEQDDLDELRATVRRLERRLRDKDGHIERLQSENFQFREDRRQRRAKPEEAEAEADEPAAKKQHDDERAEFIRKRSRNWRQQYPDSVENMTDDELADQIRAMPDYQTFDRVLVNEHRVNQLAAALLEIFKQVDAMRVGDPEFDPSDPSVQRFMQMGLTARQAHLLQQAERGEKGGGRGDRDKKPKRKRDLDRRRPKGEATSGRRSGHRGGRLTKEQSVIARTLGLTDEEYLAATPIRNG